MFNNEGKLLCESVEVNQPVQHLRIVFILFFRTWFKIFPDLYFIRSFNMHHFNQETVYLGGKRITSSLMVLPVLSPLSSSWTRVITLLGCEGPGVLYD